MSIAGVVVLRFESFQTVALLMLQMVAVILFRRTPVAVLTGPSEYMFIVELIVVL